MNFSISIAARCVSMLLICFAVTLVDAEERVWNDTTGKYSVKAELVKVSAQSVSLRRSDDGRIIEVPLNRLSFADKVYVAKFGQVDSAKSQQANKPAKPIKVTGKIKWSEPQYGYGGDQPVRFLQLEIEAKGKLALGAIEYGMLKIKSLTSNSDDELVVKQARFDDVTKEFVKITRSDGYFWEHPKDGIRVSVNIEPPAKKIQRVSLANGSFKIKTGGERSEFTIANALTQAGKDLDMTEFKEMGLKAKVKVKDTSISLELDGEEHRSIYKVEAVGANGKPLDNLNGHGDGGGGNLHQYFFGFEDKIPADLAFKVHVAKNTTEVDVPFEFENLRVPKMPSDRW